LLLSPSGQQCMYINAKMVDSANCQIYEAYTHLQFSHYTLDLCVDAAPLWVIDVASSRLIHRWRYYTTLTGCFLAQSSFYETYCQFNGSRCSTPSHTCFRILLRALFSLFDPSMKMTTGQVIQIVCFCYPITVARSRRSACGARGRDGTRRRISQAEFTPAATPA